MTNETEAQAPGLTVCEEPLFQDGEAALTWQWRSRATPPARPMPEAPPASPWDDPEYSLTD